MKIVICLILNAIFAIALIVWLYFLRESNLQREEYMVDLDRNEMRRCELKSLLRRMEKENNEQKAELEKNIAARSRLKEMLAEARRSAP